MLVHLTVENYALIDRLDMDVNPRLSIITGETGAGKSILLGALGLLLGNKNESGSLRDESRNCVIEGTFDIEAYGLESFFDENDLEYEPQTLIRRIISPSGKSRAFVNDMPVQLVVLKALGARLIDIHSQHQNLILADENFRVRAIDAFAGTEGAVKAYRAVYDDLRQAERELKRMEQEAESLRKDEEWLHFQVEEFKAAALREGELAEAEAELLVLENADQISEVLTSLRNTLDADQIGVLEQLATAENSVGHISRNYPRGEEIASRLHSVVQELKDIGATVADDSERIDSDPERLQRLTDRVNMIHSMCQKHRVKSLEELLEVGNRLTEQLSVITHGEENLEQQRVLIDKLHKDALAKAGAIRKSRIKAATETSNRIVATLRALGMPEAQFSIEVSESEELLPTGGDRIRFMFTANGRMALQPVEKIASGGEISRVMLALKALLAERSKLPTIIFDEIDTGVSGRIADAMGEIIRNLSENMQVVAITHLPQVASKGDAHYVVYKSDSRTNINLLNDDERIEEIAKMLSGSAVTAAAVEQARLLLGR
ncbi:MAG: DNA repair protein RecN [Alistipes sp.]|nr:DNA repair protein RecN [Alistipes sp.]